MISDVHNLDAWNKPKSKIFLLLNVLYEPTPHFNWKQNVGAKSNMGLSKAENYMDIHNSQNQYLEEKRELRYDTFLASIL